jgi:hypothetical protein
MSHHKILSAAAVAVLAMALGLAAGGGCAQLEQAGPAATVPASNVPATYKGTPWEGKPQVIPGQVWAAYYDVGGNGVAYSNQDTKNHGSGELNRGPEPKNNFRKDEGISISYTKFDFDKWGVDGNHLVTDEYYMGWTSAGESVNCTVDVKEAGTYVINLKASANNPGAQVSFTVMGGPTTGPLDIEKTGYYHTWKMYNNIAELKLKKGLNVITFKIEKEGNMNIMWFEFVPKGATK